MTSIEPRVCMVCGKSDRLLRAIGSSWLCLNVERCQTGIVMEKAEQVRASLTTTDMPWQQQERVRALTAEVEAWTSAKKAAAP